MSGLNGTVVESLTRPARTASYAPAVYGSWLASAIDGRPRFTWLEAERMRLDPQVQFGLRILRAPLWGVTWKVAADRSVVAAWIDRELTRVYRRMLPRLLRMYEYGVAAGEVTFKASRSAGKTRVHFDEFLELHPRDTRPIVYDRGPRAGKLAGLKVSNSPGGVLYLDRRHGFWLRGEYEYGAWFGRARLAGAFPPWIEKRGRNGACDIRSLFYKKNSLKGPFMRYPPGRTDVGSADSPLLMSNQDIAREIVEKYEAGGVLAMPNVKGPTGDFLWTWEDPKTFSDVAGLLEYPKVLDREILIGLGIPPELVEASTVGSGYSGRAIPAQVFFSSMDETAELLVQEIDRQILKPLVRLNFGKSAYEIKLDSLAKLVASTGPGAAPPAGGDQGDAAPRPGGGPIPYQGPRGGQGFKNPATGKISYSHLKPPVRLSLTAKRAAKERRRERREAAADRERERLRLSWTQYAGPRGGHGWVSDTGEVRYQPDMPGDEGEKGPESVFAHPDFAHIPAPTEEPDYAAVRQRWHKRAEADGIDPAELHRRAAFDLHQRLDSAVRPGGRHGKPEDMAAIAEWRAWNAPGLDSAQRQDLLREAAEWKSSKRQTPAVDRGHNLTLAYSAARDSLVSEKKSREGTAAFAGTYFDKDSESDRAEYYLDALENDANFDPEHLDADTKAKVAEDLVAALPPDELLAHITHAADQYGTDSGAFAIARTAASLVPAVKPVRFDGAGHTDYSIVSLDELNDDQRAGIEAAARISPAVKARFVKGAMIIPADGPLGEALEEMGIDHKRLDYEEGYETLFGSVDGNPLLGQHDVPKSAKDFGTTSGSLAPEKVDDSDWDPSAVDTYKRIDDNWYLRRLGTANPKEAGFEVVHRKDVPPLSRLPDAYWANYDPTTPYRDEEGVERTEKRAEKATAEGAEAGREIRETGKARDFTKLAGRIRGEHLRTGNLVRSDDALRDRVQAFAGNYDFSDGQGAVREDDGPTRERLDALEDALAELREIDHGHDFDPDAIDEFDSSLLTGEHDSRAEHAETVRATSDEYRDWSNDAWKTQDTARTAARSEFHRFRSDLGVKLRALRVAAQAVVGLPTNAIEDEARESAREIAGGVLKIRARARRPIRMSLGSGDPDPAKFRRGVLAAMLHFQELAHAKGDPEAAAPYLEELAKLAADPQAAARLQLSWVAQQTKKGTMKAVGDGPDAGRVLYGKRAAAALRAQQARGGRSSSEHREHVARSEAKAREILLKLHGPGEVTAEHLEELATHLPALRVERLRRARTLLGASWGGKLKKGGMVDRLVDHVRGLVDEMRGGPPEPAPPGRLFGTGAAEPSGHTRAAHAIADAARWRMPGLDVEHPAADAPLTEHLDALTAIDRHARGLGAKGSFFTDLAEHVDKIVADLKAGKIDAEDARDLAQDFGRGYFDGANPYDVADELRAAGHPDAARFFQRHAHKTLAIAQAAVEQAAGGKSVDNENKSDSISEEPAAGVTDERVAEAGGGGGEGGALGAGRIAVELPDGSRGEVSEHELPPKSPAAPPAGAVASPPVTPPPPPAPPKSAAQPDYSKFDALLRTANDRAQAEQIAKATGVPIRPAPPPERDAPDAAQFSGRIRAALADPSHWADLAADLTHPAVKGSEVEKVIGELFGADAAKQARRLTKAKMVEWLKGQRLPK